MADDTIESGGAGAETLTVTEDNTLVLWAYLWTDDANAQTTATDFTPGDIQYTQLGIDATIGYQYWLQSAASNVTNRQTTLTPVTALETGQNCSVVVSLKETAAAAGNAARSSFYRMLRNA
jgi:hypothetical protein